MVSGRPVEYVADGPLLSLCQSGCVFCSASCGFFRGEKRGEALPYKTVIVVDPLDFAFAHDLFLEQ